MESTTNLSNMTWPDLDVDGSASSSWLGLFGRLFLALLHLLIVTMYWIIRIAALLVANLATGSWTITMNATTLVLILVLSISFAAWVVYYRVLNTYAKSDPVSQRKEPEVDLFPDTRDEDIKSGLSTYFEEFLSAIKIFGYVERSVFHELTRSMQMRKLIAGETFNLEEEKGFCTVVDGLVEIFVKSGRNSRFPQNDPCLYPNGEGSYSDEDESPAHQRYQLLTEVRNGAPMSSLFSLMSLFTEDVHLRQTEDDGTESNGSGGASRYPFPRSAGLQVPSDVTVPFSGTSDLHEGANELGLKQEEPSQASPTDGQGLPTIPPIALDRPSPIRPPRKPSLPKRKMSSSAHPDILARATVDTTIAIIPASAFRRLIKVYPKATAHIVHVILTRFQRVTLATSYAYLGLTGEVLQTEKEMINYTTCELPNMLRGDPLARLKEKFADERRKLGEDDEGKGVALHKTVTEIRPRSSPSLRKEAVLQYMAKQRPLSVTTATAAPLRERASSHSPSPGDLAGAPSAKSGNHRYSPTVDIPIERAVDALRKERTSPLAQRSFNPFNAQMHTRISIDARESVEESNIFRASILECMFKALGLGVSGAVSREPESVEGSPRLVSYDSRRQKAIFSNNAFGFMSPFEGSGEGETESTASGGMPMHTSPNAHILANDMKDEVEIVFFRKGSVLIRQGERSLGLYYVIDGLLDVCTSADEASSGILHTASESSLFQTDPSGPGSSSSVPFPQAARPRQESVTDGPQRRGANLRQRRVALVRPGGLAGYIDTISSCRSFVDVVAQTDVYVGFLPLASLDRIVDKYPIVLLTMAKRLTNLLPRLILHIDFALEWVQVDAGQVIFHQGEESDAIYIVLNGRLRLVEDRKDGSMGVREEYGQGESVGELEVLTESVRSGTLHAIRDTELVKFPRTLFNNLAQEHPNITIKISKIIASRMRNLVDNAVKVSGRGKETGSGAAVNKGSSTVNLRTVAILPVTQGVPVEEFGNRLMNALAQVGPANGATALIQKSIVNHLGKHAFNKMGKLKLSQYLAELEEKYGLVLYIADTHATSPWTQTCIAQADCILLVGLAAGSPEIGEFERFMLGMKTTARKILVLVHPERYSPPGLTRKWLNNRVWINGGHYHVQMTFREDNLPVQVPIRRIQTILKERVQILQAEVKKYTSRKAHHSPFYSPDAPFKSDFHRLARKLCGKSIGLVLGGGGARGIAQIGIIRAMEDAGIPVDMVGGTSIGSFIGALYARHANFVPIYGLAKRFAGRMASKLKFAVDLTYPSTAYTTGHVFNRGIHGTFGNVQIEDFWLEFYCNTTNISKSRAEFHTSGHAWRYIRASMSLAGLLPPMCSEGDLLLDGGYVDNLTVSHMKWLGADKIFAIDVGSLDDDTPQKYGDTLSGVWAFFNRWNPFSSHPNPPTLAEIQARLAYVSSVDALERAKTMPGCIYMRPPINDYATLDFGKFDEIYRVGYQYGKDFVQDLRDQGRLPMVEAEAKKALRRTMAPRRASI